MIQVSDRATLSENQKNWLLQTYLKEHTDPFLKELNQYVIDNYGFSFCDIHELNYSSIINIKIVDERKFLIFLIKSV